MDILGVGVGRKRKVIIQPFFLFFGHLVSFSALLGSEEVRLNTVFRL